MTRQDKVVILITNEVNLPQKIAHCLQSDMRDDRESFGYLEEVKMAPLTLPKVEHATKNGMIHDITPKVLPAKV